MNIMLRTYLTLRGHILLDILQRHMYKVVNGHLQCRHTYICLAAIVRVSEPLNVLLPPSQYLSLSLYDCGNANETQTLNGSCHKKQLHWFFLDKNNANYNYFTAFIRRHVFFFNQISRILASLRGNKKSSFDFSLYNFVLTPVYSSQCDQQLRATTLYMGPFRDTCYDCGIFFVGPAWNNCIGELSALSIQREVRDQRDGYTCVYITYTLSRYPF